MRDRARSKRQMTSSSCPHTGPPWLSLWGSGLGEVSGPIGGAGGFDWVGWRAGLELRVPRVHCFPWKIHRISRELRPQAWV